jgi:mannosyl-oligosaccharide glucosidase
MEPTHTHMKAVVGLMKNETELWSPFGIRSLSTQDEYYKTGDDYWRSPIWININFMILEQLLVSRRTLK